LRNSQKLREEKDEQKPNKAVISPELENNKNFLFSKRNYFPRQNLSNFDEKKKLNPFDFYSNNYFPSTMSPRKNQVTMEYFTVPDAHLKPSFYQSKQSDELVNNFRNFYSDEAKLQQYTNFFYQNLHRSSSSKSDNLSTKSHSPNYSSNDLTKVNPSEGYTPKRDSNFEESKGGDANGKKSHFVERQGDWICTRCKNLNFSFRIVCNRCKISKVESEMLYEGHMQNIYNIIKYNQLIQDQIMLTQGSMPNLSTKNTYPMQYQKTPQCSSTPITANE